MKVQKSETRIIVEIENGSNKRTWISKEYENDAVIIDQENQGDLSTVEVKERDLQDALVLIKIEEEK